jgi:hypothetical protein
MKEDIQDLIDLGKLPNANCELLIEDAFRRGLKIGKDLAKKNPYSWIIRP